MPVAAELAEKYRRLQGAFRSKLDTLTNSEPRKDLDMVAMAWSARFLSSLSLVVVTGPLVGCVIPAEPVKPELEPELVPWVGTSSGGPATADGRSCPPLAFEVFVADSIVRGTAMIDAGTDEPRTAGATRVRVDGNVLGAIDFILTLRTPEAWPAEAMREETVWRGPIDTGTIVAREQPPGCQRSVTLVRRSS